MEKTVKIVWRAFVVLIIVLSLIGAGLIYSNRDEIVTSKITMDYFIEVVNKNNENMIKSFVAKSNNDVLYNNFVSLMDNRYHFEGVRDFNFEITNKETFGNGKYQCYFSNELENYIPKCDLENEGRYINYLVDIEVSYTDPLGEKLNNKEKGLVVFVKDMEKGNYFTWKLVRFDKYKVKE